METLGDPSTIELNPLPFCIFNFEMGSYLVTQGSIEVVPTSALVSQETRLSYLHTRPD